MSTHMIMKCFNLGNKNNIYLIIWTLCLARAMKSLSQDKLIGSSYLSSEKWNKLDKLGIVFPQP